MAAPYSLSGYCRTVGATCKFTLRQLADQSQIWNVSTGAFETYTAANIANYGITATIGAAGSLLRVGNIPTAVAGLYVAELWELAGASLAMTDDLCAGPMIVNWTGTDIVSVSGTIINNAFTYSATSQATWHPPTVYYQGAGIRIRFTADPPTAIDLSAFAVDIGVHGDYDTYTEANGGLIAVDESLGIFDANPTSAQSAAWPTEDVVINAWRLETDDNRVPVVMGKVKIIRTLRGAN